MKKRAPADYEVGYSKPPKGHQFKPGNPAIQAEGRGKFLVYWIDLSAS
jgi:hypothetical protein